MPAGKRWIPLDFCAKMVAGGKIKYMETTLAKSIRVTNEKAAYDAACKRLLSEKMILAWIMKECVQEYAGMDVREIVKYIEGAPQTAEEAMNALKVPDSDREKYFSMLKQQ